MGTIQNSYSESLRSRRHKLFADLAAPTLLLLVPFLNFVLYHRYDIFSHEVWRILAFFVVIGLGIGAVITKTHGPLRALILTAMFLMYVDLQTHHLGLKTTMIVGIGGYFLARVLESRLTTIVTFMAATVIIVALTFPDRQPVHLETESDSREIEQVDALPPVIHLILDEYSGVEGLPQDMEFSPDLRREIVSLFVENGFRLSGGAYSQYYNTYNSIGNTLNFTASSIDAASFNEFRQPYILRKNAYFRILSEQGYRFRIYQSSFMDYCQVPEIVTSSCQTYHANSIKHLEGLSLSAKQKSSIIRRTFMSLSTLRTLLRAAYNRLRTTQALRKLQLPFWTASYNMSGPIPVIPLLGSIADDVAASKGGEVFFAHLLLPHALYIFDENCDLKNDTDEWRERYVLKYPIGQPNSRESRIETYRAYVEQLKCTNRVLAGFFAQLRESGKFDDAIIILHGDHGARINRNWPTIANRGKLVDSDFIDGFPTLFAAKSPTIESGYSSTRTTLPVLLAEILGTPELAPDSEGVYLYDGIGKKMEWRRMPIQWMELPTSH